MFYVHYDTSGRPDMFSGFKSKSKDKAIEYCNSLLPCIAYVSELIKDKNKFKPYCFSNNKLIETAPELLKAVQLFNHRVDQGEIRSKKTYSKFKELIKKATQ